MKTIEEAADDYSCRKDNETESYCGFKNGVQFAQRWIPVEEEKPEYMEELLLKFVNGTHEVGYFLRKKGHEDAFYSYIQPNIEFRLEAVTHWRPIDLK